MVSNIRKNPDRTEKLGITIILESGEQRHKRRPQDCQVM
jgi:hypothetical protein